MSLLTLCPCCSDRMVRYIGNHKDYWFCRHCWQEMPNLEMIERQHSERSNQIVNLSVGLDKLKTTVSV